MVHDELVEKVAMKIWIDIMPDLRAEWREGIWNGTYPSSASYLQDDDPDATSEYEDGEPGRLSIFMCPLGRNSLRAIARAVLSVAKQAIREECAAVVKTKHDKYLEKWKSAPLPNGYLEGMVDGADEIEDAIRAME